MKSVGMLRSDVASAVPPQYRGDPQAVDLSHLRTKKQAQQEARKVRQVASAVRLVRDDLYAEMRRINGAAINAGFEVSKTISDDDFENGMRAFESGGDASILQRIENQKAARRRIDSAADAAIEPCNQLLAEIGKELHRLRDIVIRIKDIELAL
jgi:hypothetical protein